MTQTPEERRGKHRETDAERIVRQIDPDDTFIDELKAIGKFVADVHTGGNAKAGVGKSCALAGSLTAQKPEDEQVSRKVPNMKGGDYHL